MKRFSLFAFALLSANGSRWTDGNVQNGSRTPNSASGHIGVRNAMLRMVTGMPVSCILMVVARTNGIVSISENRVSSD